MQGQGLASSLLRTVARNFNTLISKAVAENHNASQEEVNRALNELKQAGTDLDGNQRYQTVREELEGLLESIREKDPKAELIEQAETLLASEMPTPQSFA